MSFKRRLFQNGRPDVPQSDLIINRAGRDDLSVRTATDIVYRSRVLEPLEYRLARLGVPRSNEAIRRSREHPTTIGGEENFRHGSIMKQRRRQLAAGMQIPDERLFIVACGDQTPSIRAELSRQ